MQTITFHSTFAGVRVDANECVIPGVSLITKGEAEGHGLICDDTTLQQIFDSAQKAGQVPVKINHGSGVENLCGYLDNFRLEADHVRGDWHLLKSHDETAKLLERAQVMPKLFGLSVAFAGSGVDVGGGKKAARCQSLKAVDCVASPAANVNGLFSTREFADNRPRTEQGMFAPASAGGADPQSMVAAYGGVAQRKQGRIARILDALKKNKAIVPQNVPELASIENLIALESRMDSILNLAEKDRGTLRKMTDAGLIGAGVIGGTLIGSKLGLRGAQTLAYRKATKGENLVGKIVGVADAKKRGIVHVGVADARGRILHVAPDTGGLKTVSRGSFISDGETLVERGNHRVDPKAIKRNSDGIGDWSATSNCEHAATRLTGRKPKSAQLRGIIGGASAGALVGGIASDRATRNFAALPSSLDAATARADANATATAAAKEQEKKRKELADRFIKSQQSKDAAKASADELSGFYKNNTFAAPDQPKKKLNPYLAAAISGGVSGAGLGAASLLRRGVSIRSALKTAGIMAASSAGIVGAGALTGSKILNDTDTSDEAAPFLKRAGLGGAATGIGAGLASALILKKVPYARKALVEAAKSWRPADALLRAGPVKATLIGGTVGGAYGAAQGADEGAQVDTIAALRRDRKTAKAKRLSSAARITEFAQQLVSSENGIPLTGKLAKDRFIKKLRDEDLNRRDANILRTGLAGAAAGALLGGKAGMLRRAAIGTAAGAAAVLGTRAATSQTRDVYGERSRGAKQAEKFLPIGAAAALAGMGIKKKLTGKFFSSIQSAASEAVQLSSKIQKFNL